MDKDNHEIDLKRDFDEEEDTGIAIEKDILGPEVMTDEDSKGYEIEDAEEASDVLSEEQTSELGGEFDESLDEEEF